MAKNIFGHPLDCDCSPACRGYLQILLEHEEDERALEVGMSGLRQLKQLKPTKQCHSCAEKIPADANFCSHCGEAQFQHCSGCHRSDLPAVAKFCPFCGYGL